MHRGRARRPGRDEHDDQDEDDSKFRNLGLTHIRIPRRWAMPGSGRGRLPVAAPDFIDENQHGVVIHVVHKCLQFVFGLPEALGHVFDQLYGIHFFKKLAELVSSPRRQTASEGGSLVDQLN